MTSQQTARIPLPDLDTMTPAQREVFDSVVNGRRGRLIGPLRAALHNPTLAGHWQKLGEVLRYNTVFPTATSEMAILLTARRYNCEVEWVLHSEVAREAGLAEEIIAAIRENRRPAFDDAELDDVHRYVCALHNSGHVRDPLYRRISERWGAIGVVELTALIGYYVMVAMTLNAHRIPLPEDRKPDLSTHGEEPALLSPLPDAYDEESRA